MFKANVKGEWREFKDIYEFLEVRPLSYSALNTWGDPQYGSPEKWHRTYILGERQDSPELRFGSIIDKRIQDEPGFLPDLPRYEYLQYEMKVMVAKRIPLVGYLDGINLKGKKKVIADFKTGKAKWDIKRAKETKQFTFYALLAYVTHKIAPEEFDFLLHWMPTKRVESGDFQVEIKLVGEKVHTFKTKRTMVEVLELIALIKKTVEEMDRYVHEVQSK